MLNDALEHFCIFCQYRSLIVNFFPPRSNKQVELDRKSPSEFSDHVDISAKDIADSPLSRSTMNCSPEFDVCRSKERLSQYIYENNCR